MANNETIADIIAEIRALSNPISDGIIAINGKSIADRLEAAWKRERAKIEADALEVGGFVEAAHRRELSKNVSKNGADFGQLGDAAKLREALEHLLHGEYRDRCEVTNIAHSALSAPPRNCDVGTAEEQAERWYWRYHVGHLCQSCPLGPRKWSEVDADTLCFSEWLQMPYEEGGDK